MPFVKHRCVGKSTVRITCKAKRGNWGQTTISSVSGRSAHHGIAGPITLHPFIGIELGTDHGFFGFLPLSVPQQ